MNMLLREKAPIADIPPRYISGIDALYFHVKVNYADYSEFFKKILLNRVLEDDETLSMLSFSYDKQYTIFQYNITLDNSMSEGVARHEENNFSFCKICFKNLNTADNLDSIKIQMFSSALQIFTIQQIKQKIQNKLNEFGLSILDTKINRLDMNCYVNGFSFDWLDYSFFNTLSRVSEDEHSINKNKYHLGQLKTFYLGSRSSSSLLMRIYDKWHELNCLKQSDNLSADIKYQLINVKYLIKYGEPVDLSLPLWNVEFEMKRDLLKNYRINTLEDVQHLTNSLFNFIVTKSVKLLTRKKELGGTNTNKILIHSVWNDIRDNFDYNGADIVPIDRIKIPKYIRDRQWLKNRINEFLAEPKNLNDPISLIARKILSF